MNNFILKWVVYADLAVSAIQHTCLSVIEPVAEIGTSFMEKNAGGNTAGDVTQLRGFAISL